MRTSQHGDTAVAFAEVTKAYGRTVALDEVSFEVARGELVALLGPNGAGKSTAVDLMLGLRQPDRGTVSVLGRPPARAAAEGKLGAMVQDGGLPAGAKVGEVVDLARRLYGRRRTLDEVLDTAGLGDLAVRRVDRLSGGQAQRVRFAVALAGDPDVLFLDEPTVGFDPEARRRFWAAVRVVAAAGTTVVFTTHYLEEVEAKAGRVVVLSSGRVVADGSPRSLKDRLSGVVVSATLAHVDQDQLRWMPGVTGVRVAGDRVWVTSRDPDATITALYRSELHPTGLEVGGSSLEEALISLSRAPVPSVVAASGTAN